MEDWSAAAQIPLIFIVGEGGAELVRVTSLFCRNAVTAFIMSEARAYQHSGSNCFTA